VPHAELVGPFPEGSDPTEYDQRRRQLLWSLPSGLFLLASRAGEERNLMTLSFLSQLATEPKLLGVSVESDALTARLVRRGGAFGVVLLGRDQRAEVRRFVKPADHDTAARTLAGTPYSDAPVTGVPIPAFARGYLDCAVTESHELGSHVLFVGEVVDCSLGDDELLHSPLRMEDTRMSYGG
jgi:flavin reductase (DIM6/NTAB) family NADH-FMN oxidoreductase RutF